MHPCHINWIRQTIQAAPKYSRATYKLEDITLLHVKGHQDNDKSISDLLLEACLGSEQNANIPKKYKKHHVFLHFELEVEKC